MLACVAFLPLVVLIASTPFDGGSDGANVLGFDPPLWVFVLAFVVLPVTPPVSVGALAFAAVAVVRSPPADRARAWRAVIVAAAPLVLTGVALVLTAALTPHL